MDSGALLDTASRLSFTLLKRGMRFARVSYVPICASL